MGNVQKTQTRLSFRQDGDMLLRTEVSEVQILEGIIMKSRGKTQRALPMGADVTTIIIIVDSRALFQTILPAPKPEISP